MDRGLKNYELFLATLDYPPCSCRVLRYMTFMLAVLPSTFLSRPSLCPTLSLHSLSPSLVISLVALLSEDSPGEEIRWIKKRKEKRKKEKEKRKKSADLIERFSSLASSFSFNSFSFAFSVLSNIRFLPW